jgi:hypothetical protein
MLVKRTIIKSRMPVYTLLLFFLLALKYHVLASESRCVDCHTNLRKLMDLSWEVKKIKPEKQKSSEISGQG